MSVRDASRRALRLRHQLDKSRRSISRIDDLLARARLSRLGVLPLLAEATSAAQGGGRAATRHGELLSLFLAVTRRRPRVVFEFGAGLSTVAIAEALRRNGARGAAGQLFSFEASPHWAERTRKLLAPAHRAVCEVRDSEIRLHRVADELACIHTGLPDVVPDMVFLDGPAGVREIEGAADVLLLQDRLPRGFLLIVDGRRRNTHFLQRHLNRPFVYSETRGLLRRAYRLRELRLTDEAPAARAPQSPVESAEKTS